MEDNRLERPHKSWTGLRLHDLPGWVAPPPRSDRPLAIVVLRAPWSDCSLLPLLLIVPKNRLCHLLVFLLVFVVLPLLWLWTALLHLLVALQARPALRHERVEGDAHLLLGQLQPAPSGRSIHLADASVISSCSEDPKIFELVLQDTGKAVQGGREGGLQHCCVLRPLEQCHRLLPHI